MRAGRKSDYAALKAWAAAFTPQQRAVLQAVLIAVSMSAEQQAAFKTSFAAALAAAA